MRTNLPSSAVGVQEPRLRFLPPEFDVGLSAERAADLVDVSEISGIVFDPWQVIGAELLTLTRSDGRWAAFEAFIAANRQQGKGTIIEGRQLAGLFVWEESLQVYTAHEFKTAQEMFLRIRQVIESTPTLDRMVQRIRTADGEEAIETKSGCRLKFMARSNSSGRGFTAPTLYLDEAMKLKRRMVASLMPTMSALSLVGNPQVMYFSSAGEVDSEVQEDVRERAVSRASNRLAYAEWSVPRWDELPPDERSRWASAEEYRADPEVHRRGNPGYNIRLDPSFVVDTELEGMGPEEFDRERLGIWAKLGGESVFPAGAWSRLADAKSTPGPTLVFAVEVAGNRESASISLLSYRADELVHAEVIDNRLGTSWIGSRLRELRDKWSPAAIVAIAGGHVDSLIPAWKREGVRVKLIKWADYVQACGVVFDWISQGKLRHLDDPVLNAAVEGVKQTFTRDNASWYWSRKNSDVDITALVALTVAVAGLEKKSGRSPGERRKAVIL